MLSVGFLRIKNIFRINCMFNLVLSRLAWIIFVKSFYGDIISIFNWKAKQTTYSCILEEILYLYKQRSSRIWHFIFCWSRFLCNISFFVSVSNPFEDFIHRPHWKHFVNLQEKLKKTLDIKLKKLLLYAFTVILFKCFKHFIEEFVQMNKNVWKVKL